MVDREALEARVAVVGSSLTPGFVKAQVDELLRQGEDVGGGINALRLVRHLVGKAAQEDAEAAWAYAQLKPALRAALEQVPALFYLEGD
jgi:hypothetical protein